MIISTAPALAAPPKRRRGGRDCPSADGLESGPSATCSRAGDSRTAPPNSLGIWRSPPPLHTGRNLERKIRHHVLTLSKFAGISSRMVANMLAYNIEGDFRMNSRSTQQHAADSRRKTGERDRCHGMVTKKKPNGRRSQKAADGQNVSETKGVRRVIIRFQKMYSIEIKIVRSWPAGPANKKRGTRK